MPWGEHPFDGESILNKNKNKNMGALWMLGNLEIWCTESEQLISRVHC